MGNTIRWSLGQVTEGLRGLLSFVITGREGLELLCLWALLVPGLSLGQEDIGETLKAHPGEI